jgi:hypothetical protein
VAQVAKGIVTENKELRKHLDRHDTDLLDRIADIETELNKVREKCNTS